MESQLEKTPILAKNQKGQSFLEFIFVFLTMISLSMLFIRGVNGLVSKRWEVMVKLIAHPSQNEVQLP